MKTKNLLGALGMALLGAAIALFAYTKIIDKPSVIQVNDSSEISSRDVRAMLTSYVQQGGQIDLTYAAEQTVHAVVNVRTKTMMGGQTMNPLWEFFYGERYGRQREPREVQGIGSGVIVSSDGYIITNNHVIEGADNVNVKLNDNREFTAEVVGRDPSTDIALLKVKAQDLPFVRYGDSDELKLGEWVLAVGNPFNLTSTVTAGIVSAKGRSLGIIERDFSVESFIQTDAALNMGNSGGALVNTKGLLVGITTAILSPSGAYAGNSFAVPISIVKKVVDDLKEFGEVQRAIMGVVIQPVTPDDAKKQNLSEVRGARITGLTEKGSAQEAGLREDDIITRVNNVAISSVAELQVQISKFRPGDKVSVTYVRNGKESSVPVILKNIAGNTGVVKPGTGTGIVFGARVEPLSQSEMRQYKVDHGVKVIEVNDGRFKDLGISRGYIILTVNGNKVKNAAEIRETTSGEKSLNSIEGIQANGTYFSFQFRR